MVNGKRCQRGAPEGEGWGFAWPGVGGVGFGNGKVLARGKGMSLIDSRVHPILAARGQKLRLNKLAVLGGDRPGIVAAVAGALCEREANNQDISQTNLQGIITMTMLVDLEKADFSELKARLDELSESLGVQIMMQREEVFRYMYRL